jgi:hypothetical protein
MACFVAQMCHLLIEKLLWHKNMSADRRVLFAVWIAIVGWRLREFWQWKVNSEDNECSCYDVTPRDGTECW